MKVNLSVENGLKIVMHKIPGIKTMSCGAWIRQGSVYETDETNGLSHLIEHLVLNADNVDNPKYEQIMDRIATEGVIYNGGTTKILLAWKEHYSRVWLAYLEMKNNTGKKVYYERKSRL